MMEYMLYDWTYLYYIRIDERAILIQIQYLPNILIAAIRIIILS